MDCARQCCCADFCPLGAGVRAAESAQIGVSERHPIKGRLGNLAGWLFWGKELVDVEGLSSLAVQP